MKLGILVADDNTAFLPILTSALGLSSTSWHALRWKVGPGTAAVVASQISSS